MGDNIENQILNVETNSSEITFDNLTILKEFSNITNVVKNEDFLEIFPNAKFKRVKWIPMFDCLKQSILDEMIQEMTAMWEYENMPEKLEILEKQKEKFSDIDNDKTLWRPQLGNVKAQLIAHDMSNLEKQKKSLEKLAKEYDNRVNRLKKVLIAKREYLRVLQTEMQKYQKKNEELMSEINDKLKTHSNMANIIIPTKIDETIWSASMDIES